MLDEISRISARISDIEGRIAALSAPSVSPAQAPAGQDAAPTFAKALTTAQAPPPVTGPTLLPGGSSVPAPPASLGPLPPLPIAPGAANIIPLPHTASANTASADMDSIIQKYAARNGLAPSLVRAVIRTESDGDPRCVSHAGAMGLMQLMPANVKEAGIADPFDPEQNIAAGTKQLAGLMAQYHGNLDLALAGYNAGPGNVHKYGGVPPFTETQNYIRRVRAAMEKG